ncbi:hypothetical protein WMF18_42400 [Sorangium sp. So ce315]|uniref:hypothetical protein n=1 Tax=Sorangium sp. So ce315 TaxID=3133299 RepID=UPI003F637387
MDLMTNSLKIAMASLAPASRSVQSEMLGRGSRSDAGRASSFLALRARMLASPCLAGALQFMQVTTRPWEPHELAAWLLEHVVAPGWMRAPRALREPGVETLELSGLDDRHREVAALTARARERVALALLDFVAPNPDGDFLRAALYGARVRWSVVDGRSTWLPAPRELDRLSDVVLSLFAAEILSDAELYRSHMTVCAGCGRVAFTQEARPLSAGCPRCDGEVRWRAR